MGTRTLRLRSQDGIVTLLLAGSDRAVLVTRGIVRLMGLFNIRTIGFDDKKLKGEYVSDSVPEAARAPILQWVPTDDKVAASVVLPDATERTGFAEAGLVDEPVGSVVQFVRFGFCRTDSKKPDSVILYFAHD
jgi:glutamyl-tRNA synthetase